jgi:FlaA1/EpsC-like NDP-sugar epimerase
VFNMTLPAVLVARYVAFIVFGLYRGVWRYAGARDAVSIFAAVTLSEVAAALFIWWTVPFNGFPLGIFFIDVLICSALVGVARFWERAASRALSSFVGRANQRRVLIVGAGSSGRSLLRETRETRGERVIAFVDDDTSLLRRRIQGVPVVGRTEDIGWVIGRYEPDVVLVTIPGAPRDRLDAVVEASTRAGITCRFVRRQIDVDPGVVLGAAVD